MGGASGPGGFAYLAAQASLSLVLISDFQVLSQPANPSTQATLDRKSRLLKS